MANDKSKGEGPSSGKGKGTDPHNWGATQLSDEELDAEEQHCAFKFWNQVKREKAIELQVLYDMQNEINADLPAPVNQEPVAEREIKQESFLAHIPSPEIPTTRKHQKVTVEDVLDDDDIQYLGEDVPGKILTTLWLNRLQRSRLTQGPWLHLSRI